jgi:hypothetical protein
MSTDANPGVETQAPASSELSNGAAPVADGDAAPAEPQQTPDGQPAGEPAKAEGETPEHRKASYRFSEMSKQLREAEKQAAYYRGLADAAQRGQNAPAPPIEATPVAQADPEPDPAKYAGKDFDPAYLRDVARWEGRQEAKRLHEELKASQTRETEAQARERAFEEGRQRFMEAREVQARAIEEQHPQYAGVVTEALDDIARMEPPNTPGRLIDVVTLTENPGWVAAALATKPELRRQILALPPERRALAIGKIDAQISANLAAAQSAQPQAPQAPAPSAPVQASPAPTPPPVVNGRGAAPSIDLNKADMNDYVRARASMQ